MSGRRDAHSSLALGAALAVVSLNLRTPITAVGPVLDDIRRTLHLSGTQAGFLTMLPLLCFGAAAPLAPRLVRRHAPEVVLLGAVVVLAAGALLRLPSSILALFAGTIVLGSAIAVANVVVPAVIKRDFPRPGTMMGVYAVALALSGALGAGLSVPLEHALGGSWRWGLAAWAVPALVAAAVWLPAARRAHAGPAAAATPRVSLWRDRRAWMISGFMGSQSLLFYAIAAWLPDVLKDHGASESGAGALLSIELLVGIPTSLLVPIVAERMADQRRLAAAAAGLWLAGLTGLIAAPEAATVLWVVLIGLGSGAGIALALTLFALRSPDGARAAALSGMAQTVGYLVAATGPLAVGALHDVTGGWTAPLGLLFGVAVLMLLFGLAGAAPGHVQGAASAPVGDLLPDPTG